MALGDWITLAAPASHGNGTVSSGSRALPVGFSEVTLRIDCTTLNPAAPFTGFSPAFSSPSMIITLKTWFSWDSGATFIENAETSAVGQPTGIWGVTHSGAQNMAPWFTRGIPWNAAAGGFPNRYKADLIVAGGPIMFGLSLRES
jgi:hypothetical protein